MTTSQHVYEMRSRKDHRGFDLISDVLPFGRLWYGEPNAISHAIGYAEHYSRSHDAVIRVYDDAGKVDRRTTNTLGYCLAPVSISVYTDPPVDLAANLASTELPRVHVSVGQPRTQRDPDAGARGRVQRVVAVHDHAMCSWKLDCKIASNSS
jgi:hypothetical protein